MADAIPEIAPRDRERIESMIAQYRSALETLYQLAHVQGKMDQIDEFRRNHYADTAIRKAKESAARPEHDMDTAGRALRPGS